MKKKRFKQLNILIATAGLIVSIMAFGLTFYSLNPERANRIFCKVLIFLEFRGCICNSQKPDSPKKQKKVKKPAKSKQPPCKVSKSATISFADFETLNWLSFGSFIWRFFSNLLFRQ